MKNILPVFEKALNISNRRQFKEIFGEGSYSKVNKIYYSGQKKAFVVDVTLYTNYPELLSDSYEVFDDFISNAWGYIGLKENLIIVKNFDLIS